MRIQVKLFANLRDRLPREARGRTEIDLPEPATLAQLIDRFDIPDALAQMVLVNGTRVGRQRSVWEEYRLAADDEVCIFPPVAGGKS
jgi:molybdopterin converting factor small subunit